jgi:YgiT-type zinc finger domain-containing protein
MNCRVCGSQLTPVVTQLPFKVAEGAIVILKGLPVLQCQSCPEFLLEDQVMATVDRILETVDRSAELEVIQYAA